MFSVRPFVSTRSKHASKSRISLSHVWNFPQDLKKTMTSTPHVLGSVCQLYNVNTLSTTEILNFYVWKSSLGSQISNLAVLCFDFGLLIQHYGNPL